MRLSHYLKRPPKLYLLFVCFYWQLHLNCALLLYNNQQQQTSSTQVKDQQAPNIDQFATNPAVSQVLAQLLAQQMNLNTSGLSTPNSNSNSNNNNNSNNNINQSNNNANNNNNNNNNNYSPASVAATTSNTQHQNTVGNYIIKWEHNNVDKRLSILSIQPYEITNLHEPRIELRYVSKHPYVTLEERTGNNTVVAVVVVYDEDTKPDGVKPTVAIEHGNELGHFKLVSTSMSNTIQTSGIPMSRLAKPEYNLTIVARDNGTPPKSSSTNLVIKLSSSPMQQPSQSAANQLQPASHLLPGQANGSSNNLPLEFQQKPPVTDLMYVGAMLVVIFSALIFLIIIGCALVQRPKNKTSVGAGGGVGTGAGGSIGHHHHHHTLKGPYHPAPSSRATSATNSRLQPTDQCSAYCSGL